MTPSEVSRPERRIGPDTGLIGRERERRVLQAALEALSEAGAGGLVVVEGEAGMGKSRLVTDFVVAVRASGLPNWIGAGSEIGRTSPYHAWRPVFQDVLGSNQRSPDAVIARTLPSTLRARAPLLNPVMAWDLPDNGVTGPLIGQARADAINDLLLRLLEDHLAGRPAAILLEDAHWLDSASWSFVRRVRQLLPRVLLVVVNRPLPEEAPADAGKLFEDRDLTFVRLVGLSDDDAALLVRKRLGTAELPEAVERFIAKRARGNPFFSEELAFALRDLGYIQIHDGMCRLAPGLDTLEGLGLPDSVEEVIASRVAHLARPLQQTLAVASVVGNEFDPEMLAQVHPEDVGVQKVAAWLRKLAHLDLTPEPQSSDRPFSFRHATMREVVYNRTDAGERARMHRTVAEWYERTHADAPAPYYPLLAHHWSLAGDRDKAIRYLDLAASASLRSYANAEAAQFLTQVLALDRDLAGSEVAERRARWQADLGQANLGLGRLEAARTQLERALATLGAPVPATRTQLMASLLGQLCMLPLKWRPGASARDEATSTRIRRIQALSEIYFFHAEKLRTVHSTVAALTLGLSAGAGADLARACANATITAGVSRMHGLARALAARARATAAVAGDPAATAFVLNRTTFYQIGVGNWDAVPAVQEAVRIFAELGDRHNELMTLSLPANSALYQGRFREARELFRELSERAARSGDEERAAWWANGEATCDLRLGRFAEAERILDRVKATLQASTDRNQRILYRARLALVRLRRNRPVEARELADAARDLVAALPPLAFYAFDGYACTAEVYVDLLPGDPALEARAAWIVKAFSRFARIFPIARPRAGLLRGRLAALGGKPGAARRAYRQALRSARALRMPYEEELLAEALSALRPDLQRDPE